MTVHAATRQLRCHHCGAERPVPQTCPHCGARELVMVGQGTERIEAALTGHFPDHEIVRIDRDSTRRKGALEAQLERANSGAARILVGTQMLAKGHHFPGVTLVGMLDADRGLFGADFRAAEQMAQLIVQVAGRAGRAERPGEVLIQTRNPDHPLLRTLIERGYPAFAEAELAQREAAALPPFQHLALLRAESPQAGAPLAFLDQLRNELEAEGSGSVWLFGPAVAPMERLAGRYRAQLLLQSAERSALQRLLYRLRPQLESHPAARKVRWSLDVDPVDLL
jgi:primosomal protein N' (replication factor Y)